MVFFFIGILLTQLLYVITNWGQYRSNDYLRYALYIFLFIAYFVCLFPAEVFNDTVAEKFYATADFLKRPIAFLLYLIYFRFMDIFLGLKEKYPRLHRQVLISYWLIFVFLLIQVALLVFNKAYTSPGNEIYFGCSFFLFGLSVLFMIKAYHNKNFLTITLLRGSVCLVTGAFITNVINIASIFTGRHLHIVPDYIPLFAGILMELFFFNLALAYKVVQDENELSDTQQKVIGQLRQNEQLVIEKQQTRNKIARDLHDEVGATLSGVALFSELALHNIARQKMGDIDGYLNRISRECTYMSDKINDIVWATRTENDTLEKLLNRLKAYAMPLCSTKEIEFSFDMDEKVGKSALATDVRNHLYLFCKEAINNSVKYSHAGIINFSASCEDDRLSIVIKDNGKGFNINKAYDGNGLKNMKSRVQEMDASYILRSAEGSGTYVQLQLKLT